MSINIQAKTNYSFLFSGLSSTASNAASSNWLADYASIKNGSYAKLMKAYYGKENTASKTYINKICHSLSVYSIFCTCSRIFSISVFKSIA